MKVPAIAPAMSTDFVLSLVMLTAAALVAGAFVYWRRTGTVKQPALMVLLAIIAVINVLIWTIPTRDGAAPLETIKAQQAE
jgi:hypothetical protein